MKRLATNAMHALHHEMILIISFEGIAYSRHLAGAAGSRFWTIKQLVTGSFNLCIDTCMQWRIQPSQGGRAQPGWSVKDAHHKNQLHHWDTLAKYFMLLLV